MKTIYFALLALFVLSSCSKTNNFITVKDSQHYYRLAVIDNNDSTTYSTVSYVAPYQEIEQISPNSINHTITIVKNSGDGVLDGSSEGDDNTSYCCKHPDDSKCRAMPVVLSYFRATRSINGDKFISWKTLMESNLNRFEIQRSEDAVNYYTIAIVIPNNQPSQYELKDTYSKK